uniref:tRNA pseudouridine(55) synthase n=1 Tax=Strigamia maritima TaxID=126957 RepID=T1J968_STRMM
MFSDAKEDVSSIIKELQYAGFCPRCILRYINVKEIEIFRSFDSVKEEIAKYLDEKIENEVPKAKKERLNPCVACYGILQELCDISKTLQIIANVKKSDYQFEDFVLALTIPLCCILQDHIILVILKKKFPNMYEHQQPSSVKEVWKWIVGAVVENEFHVSFNVVSKFDIIITTNYENDSKECEEILNKLDWIDNTPKKNLKKFGPSRAKVEKAITELRDEKIISCTQWPPTIPNSVSFYKEVKCFHKSLYLGGRYNKFSRKLSQTPWLVDGEKLMETSIQELICEKLETHIKADDVKFSASGREDVDVRTLGRGRPFVLEFVNPRRIWFTQREMLAFQKEINQSTNDIAVRDLQIVSRDEVSELRVGEEYKTKTYSARCFSRQPLTTERLNLLQNFQNLTLRQKTPIRVLHRRPLAVRQRVVHEIKASLIDTYHFKITLTTQAGTYVKEFVHGDFGRTEPSLGTILNVETDILELDVESVQLDWPPTIDEESN